MRPSATSPISALVLLCAALVGCDPSCEQVCEKLIACDDLGTERMSAGECEEQCREQQDLYGQWDDAALRQSFQDHLGCLQDSACDDIAAGVCYDEDVFTF